jgi:NTE family protein
MRWKWIDRLLNLRPDTVLALSGGGARGLSHIGVLEEFDNMELKPDLITGTSIGAIVGALYCLHGNSGQLESIAQKTVESDTFKRFDLDELLDEEDEERDSFADFGARIRRAYTLSKMMRKISVIDGEVMDTVMDEMFGDATFDDLKIPFAAVATDLISGEDYTIAEGSLATAVKASASIPGVFPPVKYDGKLLVDGGVSRNVPIPEPGDTGVDASIVVVDVMRGMQNDGPYKYGLDIISRTEYISQVHLNRFYLERADLVIVPNVKQIHWADFRNINDLVKEGKLAIQGHENALREIFS